MFGELGCDVIDADSIGHALLERAEIVAALQRQFGSDIIDAVGAVDRRVLGQRAFADASSLAALNTITHPPLREELVRRIEAFRQGSAPAAVLDAALLLETDWHELCDVLVFVDAPWPQRLARVAESRGWSAEQLVEREKYQKSVDIKKAMSEYVVENNSSASRLHQQICLLYQRLISSAVLP